MRYYSEISKKDFLSKVKELMENDEYPYETSKSRLILVGKIIQLLIAHKDSVIIHLDIKN